MYGDVFGNRVQDSSLPGLESSDPVETPSYQWQPALDLSRRAPKYGMRFKQLGMLNVRNLDACIQCYQPDAAVCSLPGGQDFASMKQLHDNFLQVIVNSDSSTSVFSLLSFRKVRKIANALPV